MEGVKCEKMVCGYLNPFACIPAATSIAPKKFSRIFLNSTCSLAHKPTVWMYVKKTYVYDVRIRGAVGMCRYFHSADECGGHCAVDPKP